MPENTSDTAYEAAIMITVTPTSRPRFTFQICQAKLKIGSSPICCGLIGRPSSSEGLACGAIPIGEAYGLTPGKGPPKGALAPAPNGLEGGGTPGPPAGALPPPTRKENGSLPAGG